MKYKYKNGGIVKLQNAWTTMPKPEDAILRSWEKQRQKEMQSTSTGRASGMHNTDLPLQTEYPEAVVFGGAKALKTIPQVLPVIMNPAIASTTAGAVTATGLDAIGLVSGFNNLDNYRRNWQNLTFNDTPGIILNGMSIIPGSSQLTNPGNIQRFSNTLKTGVSALRSKSLHINEPTIRLYRATGTSGNFTPSPDGTAEFAGQWFTNDPDKVWWYGENALKSARRAGVENPIELQVVDVPKSQLESYRASNIIKDRSDIEFEPEDFLIPLSMPRKRTPLNLTGNIFADMRVGLPENHKILQERTISDAERLGISKSMRSNPKALEDPYYWGYQQWNQRYNAAVESGNMEEAQRLRDLHFKIKTPDNKIVDYKENPHKVYHGSPENWYIFDDSKRGIDDVIYFSTDKAYADQYTIPRSQWQKGMIPTKSSREFYLYGKEPINVGSDMYYGSVQDELIHNWANGLNADSVYGLDAITNPLNQSSGVEFGVLRRNQFKLTKPITKTNTGEIIPIVKRDNFRNPDIRYKQGGIIKGQNGFLNIWQKAYDSKFGKGLRDFMFGKDKDLSDEEYLEKHGHNKPVGGLGPFVEMTTIGPVSDFSGVSNIVKGTFGNGGVKANVGLQNLNTEKRALQLLKSYDEELKRDRVALEWAGKKWNELTNTEKYWLKVRQGHQWNDKLIIPRNI